jgi:hypothetical protein
MTAVRLTAVALAIAAAVAACSSKGDHPPISTEGPGHGLAGGGGTGLDASDDSSTEDDSGVDADIDATICTHLTCSGCCDINGACQAGTSPLACGIGGIECIPCSQSQTKCAQSDGGYFCQ